MGPMCVGSVDKRRGVAGPQREADEAIRAVLRGLLDTLFSVAVGLGGLAMIANLSRALFFGWCPAFTVDLIAFVGIVGVLAARRVLPPMAVLGGIVGMTGVTAVMSLSALALASTGMMALLAAAIMVGVFGGRRAGVLAVAVALAAIAVIAASQAAGWIRPSRDVATLTLAGTSWITHGLTLAVYALAVILAAHAVQQRLVRSLADLREQSRAREEAVARLRLLSENVSDVVFVQDIDLRVLYVTPSVERLTGYTPDEILALDMARFHTPESLKRAMATYGHYLALAAEGPVDVPLLEFEYVRKDGTTFPGEMHVAFSYDAEGRLTGCQGILRDVSERKQAEAERLALEEELRQADKLAAIGRLAGGVAHDFNNQLAVITTFAELLQRERDASPRTIEAASSILTAARRSADLTRQLLAFARRGHGRSVPVDLHALVHEVSGMIERSVDKRIRVVTRLFAPAAWTVGDPSQLANALLNLALNGRDAMPEGGDLTFATTIVECAPAGAAGPDGPARWVELSVSDTGLGMDDEARQHLFEPFYTTKQPGAGTGLGLAAVYGTIASHRGSIDVESEPGRGTTFRVRLPLVAPPPEISAEPPAARRQPDDGPATILVIDDEELVCRATARALEDAGYRPRTFTSPRAGLAHYQETWPEIAAVILDLVMPELGAKDVLTGLLAVNPRAVVLLVSGYSRDARVNELLDLGVCELLQKPYQQEQLIAALERLLPRRLVPAAATPPGA